jgi:nanoRNase/pAp phosphatase (c-di-AMP/oligoRNAs hydrolase)
VITRETEERFAAFHKLVEATSPKERWLVLAHDNPDPDSLAAAMLLSDLLRRHFHRRVTAGYGGIIGRAENREMFRRLGHRFSHARHLNFKNYPHVALVDAQPGTGNSQLPPEQAPRAVFDHHPIRKATYAVPFYDVRPSYGATATIVAEYVLASGIEIPRSTATGLVYAIRTETQDFGREAGSPDKAIYDIFLPKVNKRVLSRIQHAPLTRDYFFTLREALLNLEGVGPLVVSHLGPVEQPDIVPEIADLLLRMEGKTWSLVTGLFKERIYLSMRTTNSRANAGKLMRRLIGKKGKGGGHGMTAGGYVSLELFKNGNPAALQKQLGRRFAKALKKNPDRLLPLPGKPAAEEPVAKPPTGKPPAA